jgi:hypothetical protein
MNEREYLVKAQEAEAIADATQNSDHQRTWETIAAAYRKLAEEITVARVSADPSGLRL